MAGLHAVKQDPATGIIAQRTPFDDGREWRVFRSDGTSHYVADVDVSDWPELAPVESS